ncbi:MAG TPA: alpha-glucan phosphorylase [Ruminococcaceae bacterium]|nr:alpha-glucan phosphorylase [Oscillospiraceae bacterium]
MLGHKYSVKEFKENIVKKLAVDFTTLPQEASDQLYYKAIVLILRDILSTRRVDFDRAARAAGEKQIYYLCMEFLLGRSLRNNLSNLGLEETARKALLELGVKLESIYEVEPDAGLGNGGLGRLAAAFLDGLATGEYPAMGYSIKYEFGIFKQKLVDGWQTELPDPWLAGGDVWFNAHPEKAVEVRFDGTIRDWWDGPYHQVVHENYSPVMAVPYDLMVSGHGGKGISVLRLWSAKAPGMDMNLFNQGDYMRAVEQNAMAEVISKVLYPADNHVEGKSLRLLQQYFLVSASVQDITKRHARRYSKMDSLPDKIAIHINDTHPALAIPELMRILLDDCGYSWDKAYEIVCRVCAYTNHTVMAEALETWPEDMIIHKLPRIYQILKEMDNRLRRSVWERTGKADTVERTAIISGGNIRMANLCVAVCHSINGVSRLHSDILKRVVFSDYYALNPEKFHNVTNGIAHRRWLNQANPELGSLVTGLIGDGYLKDAEKLEGLLKYENDKSVLTRLEEVKRANKEKLAKYILKTNGMKVDIASIFDVQLKRMHEYKRQHMNALHILSDYIYLKENPNADMLPRTYIFGAKAAPGYYMAKEIIQLICKLSEMIEKDPAARDLIKVVYMEDYRVTLAEIIMPAAELSEQISLAGTEASGTGNMKLMQGGAITIGTEDGANVEIHEAVGDENIIIFGMTADQVQKRRAEGYAPGIYYAHNQRLKAAVDMLSPGFCGRSFDDIAQSLLRSDPYMVMADFGDYCGAHNIAQELYKNREKWNRMSLVNIAKAGRFAADRAVREYARDIWQCGKR